jgi:hypothetical protein
MQPISNGNFAVHAQLQSVKGEDNVAYSPNSWMINITRAKAYSRGARMRYVTQLHG